MASRNALHKNDNSSKTSCLPLDYSIHSACPKHISKLSEATRNPRQPAILIKGDVSPYSVSLKIINLSDRNTDFFSFLIHFKHSAWYLFGAVRRILCFLNSNKQNKTQNRVLHTGVVPSFSRQQLFP